MLDIRLLHRLRTRREGNTMSLKSNSLILFWLRWISFRYGDSDLLMFFRN